MSEQKETNKQKAKCKYCEESIPKGGGVKHSNRYYHPHCLEEWRGQADDRTQLIDYIMELYGLKKPTGKILQQIKRYHEDPELNYTHKGMELTLRYYYELLENKPRAGDGIGIIPYEYENATAQYVQQMKIRESVERMSQHKQEERVVYISPKQHKQNKSNRKIIDISEL